MQNGDKAIIVIGVIVAILVIAIFILD